MTAMDVGSLGLRLPVPPEGFAVDPRVAGMLTRLDALEEVPYADRTGAAYTPGAVDFGLAVAVDADVTLPVFGAEHVGRSIIILSESTEALSILQGASVTIEGAVSIQAKGAATAFLVASTGTTATWRAFVA